MNKPAKSRPKLKSEAQERAFWEAEGRDSTQYLDWTQAQRAILPNLKPSTKTISLRLPQHLLDAIKAAPALAEMALVRVGRLSVVPVTPAEWQTILTMGGAG